MTGNLVVDTAALRRAADETLRVWAELDGATRLMDGLGEAVGHAGLAHRLEGFTSSWSVHRKRLADAMDTLSSAARTMADGFESADRELAGALRGDGTEG